MIVGSVLAAKLINLANDDQGERKGKNEGKKESGTPVFS